MLIGLGIWGVKFISSKKYKCFEMYVMWLLDCQKLETLGCIFWTFKAVKCIWDKTIRMSPCWLRVLYLFFEIKWLDLTFDNLYLNSDFLLISSYSDLSIFWLINSDWNWSFTDFWLTLLMVRTPGFYSFFLFINVLAIKSMTAEHEIELFYNNSQNIFRV